MRQEHYFTPDPQGKHQLQKLELEILGQKLVFWTDRGVFSKRKLDRGTRLLLESIDLGEAKRVLDLGCGYGPIGITLAKLAPHVQFWLSDINKRAVELAQRNAEANGLKNCQVLCGDGFEPFSGERFNLIVTNPPVRAGKKVIYELFAQAKDHLTEGGRLVLVMRTQQGAKSALRKLAEIYPRVEEAERGGGFRVLECWRS